MPRDPVLATIYGPPGTGKTTDLCYSFPRALWIAAPGSTAVAESVCGYPLVKPPIDIESLDAAIRLLEELQQNPKIRAEVDALVIDDLTLYVDRTIRVLNAQGVGARDPRQLWGVVRMKLLTLRDTARRAGIHVVMNTHEGPPKVVNGARVRGGPALPGAGAELIPAACDLVLRAVPNGNIPIGWKVEYRCTIDDQDYTSKDRYNVTPDHSPMNVGEILRVQGFTVRRLAGLEWQEEIVEKLAAAMIERGLDLPFVREAMAVAFAESMKRQAPTNGVPGATQERRAIWTQRDAFDRAVLRNAQTAHRRRLFG
jgi:hypothetical protein